MLTVTLTRINEQKPFLTTCAESENSVIHAAMSAYSAGAGEHHTAELVEKIGGSAWRLQPGRMINRGSVSLDSPIIVEAKE